MSVFLKDWLLPFAVGTAVGVLSGFGIGGGTILLVYLTAAAGMDQHLAQGINLLYFLPAAVLALPSHRKHGLIEKKALLPAICAGLACAGVSAWISAGIDTKILRKIFGGFLILVGSYQIILPNVRKR